VIRLFCTEGKLEQGALGDVIPSCSRSRTPPLPCSQLDNTGPEKLEKRFPLSLDAATEPNTSNKFQKAGPYPKFFQGARGVRP
jgi:hypothetical protein